MHGKDREEEKKIAHERISSRIQKLYGKREALEYSYGHLFREPLEYLTTRSTQYLTKWVASYRMAETMITRAKLKPGEGGIRSGRRDRGKNKVKGAVGQLGPTGIGGLTFWFPIQCGLIQTGIKFGVYAMVTGRAGFTQG